MKKDHGSFLHMRDPDSRILISRATSSTPNFKVNIRAKKKKREEKRRGGGKNRNE